MRPSTGPRIGHGVREKGNSTLPGCKVQLWDRVPYSPPFPQGNRGRPQHSHQRNLAAEGAEAPQHSQVRATRTLPISSLTSFCSSTWSAPDHAARGAFQSFTDYTERSKTNKQTKKMQESLLLPCCTAVAHSITASLHQHNLVQTTAAPHPGCCFYTSLTALSLKALKTDAPLRGRRDI